MLARGLAFLILAAISGCASTSMPNIPNEPPIEALQLQGPISVVLSPLRIKTSQGTRTFVSSYFSERQPMPGWRAGEEYPAATQTITDELRDMDFHVYESTEGLLAPRVREKLDFLISGTLESFSLDIHDTYSGNYSEGHYRLTLKFLDMQSGEPVWEGESDGYASLGNNPEVRHDLATGSNIVASLSQNEDRVSRLIIKNAFRSMIRAHSEKLRQVFTLRAAHQR